MTQIKEYKIEVKSWMTKKSTPNFTLMKDLNNDIPMPLMVMYGVKIGETARRVKMKLHGDIKQRVILNCMHCGRPITNKISQYFGIGPICGGHNYTNPFDSEEELNRAIAAYREKLVNITWVGYIPKSAIVSIDDDSDIETKLAEMQLEVCDESDISSNCSQYPVVPKIYARVDKPVRGTGDFSVFLRFDYNPGIVSAIKDGIITAHRSWDPEKKQWEIDYSEFNKLKETLSTFDWEVENEDIVPAPVTVDSKFNFKTTPMQHQIEGVQYGLDHRRFLLGDQQGLGKTKQIIDLACIRKKTFGFKHCLIIACVNSLKWNWLEEIEKHSNETGFILGQYMMPRRKKLAIGSNADKLAQLEQIGKGSEIDSHYFIITNIESLRNPDIAAKLKELCDNHIIDMIAADEVHRVKNLDTKQGQGLIQLQPPYRVAMTGTPLINTPLDLYAILKWSGYQPYEFKSFKYHFCQYDEWGNIVGYKNINQLREQLQSIMLRRTKEEVMPYLPEKIYKTEYVELTDEQKKVYNDVIDGVINDDTLETAQDCELVLKLRLRQVSGGIGPFRNLKKVPKLDRLEQLVEEAVYAGTKVIVYSNWVEGIEPAIERLSKYNPVVITGATDDADRQALVNKFQNDSEVKVIIGTIGALGTGFTLTAATEVIFLDEPWNDATKEQAVDRAHRYGTKSAVTIYTLISYGTYDEDVHDIVLGKKELSSHIVDRQDLKMWKVA